MSRIQEAIERARKARADVIGNPTGRPRVELDETASSKVITGSLDLSACRHIELDEDVLRKNRVVIHGDEGQPAESAFKILRTRVQQRMRANKWVSLGVSGPSANNGKTVTAANLALSLSLDPTQTVCLVDLDLRRPALGKIFGIEPEVGFTSVVDGSCSITDAMFASQFDRLYVMPQAYPVSNSSELMRSEPALRLLHSLRDAQPKPTVLIFDLPPLTAADDVIALETEIDTILMVVAEGRTSREEVRRASELMEHINSIGTVLNMSSESAAEYQLY